jgi:hypothetical protein
VKIFYDLIQGSDEWKAARKGRPSTSNLSNIITAARGDLSKTADAYIIELIAECFAPEWEEFVGNRFTERGIELEPEARDAFIAETGLNVIEVGGVLADDGVTWCSPDGLIMDESGDRERIITGVEIKCPSPKVHIGYIIDGKLPDAYKQQVHGQMAVTGAKYWHFWSYFPGLRPFHTVVYRNDYTEKLEQGLHVFVEQYQQRLAEITPLVALPVGLKGGDE